MPFPLLSKTSLHAMKRAALILTLLLPFVLSAQTPFVTSSQRNIRLPQGLDNLSTTDNHLYGFNHLLVSTPISLHTLPPLQPDTLWANIIPNADYIVRNPRDSILYFTRRDPDGTTNLYTYDPQLFRKIHRINIHGWQRDICHPTFSANGKMMVFTSMGKVGLGGYDLWCSLWNGHRWTRPINLGNTINTPGNETSPVFYNDFLIFTSDSIPNSQPGKHIYSCFLREASSIDEIIFDTYTVQPLPYPINGNGNDMNIAFHQPSSQGWWVSTRSGQKELYTFTGQLDAVMVSGIVTDIHNQPLPHATIKMILHNRTAATTTSDNNGHYQLLVLPNDDYLLQASLNGYFNYEQELPAIRTTERLLITPLSYNIQLTSLPLNQPIMLQDIFSQGTDIQLSPNGINALKPTINFLRDNPQIRASISVYCDQTDDETFNNILIERRINTLQQYIHSYLPSDTQFSILNGNTTEQIEPSNTGTNFIFITFSK